MRNDMVFFQLLLYCFFIKLSDQFSLRNCTMFNHSHHQKMKCCRMNFTMVPSPIPIYSTDLDISGNKISAVKVGDLSNLTTLKFLFLSKNKISKIEDGAFKDLIHLQTLHLHSNKLRSVTRGWTEGLVSLSQLRLSENDIKDIEQSAFDHLSNLTSVNLARNRLKYLEQVKPILHLPNLLSLSIRQNHFYSFRSHNLSAVPLNIQKLDLSSNPLRAFQMTNNILPQLNCLDISFCGDNGSFQWIIQDQRFLNSIETFNVSGLQTSEEGLAKIIQSFNSSLKTLEINDFPVPDLEIFLQTICIPVQKVLFLKFLMLSLHDHLFKPCHQLCELNLADNAITNVSSLAFEGLHQLETLRLEHNQITELNNFAHVLPELRLLDLSFNNIRYLTSFQFNNSQLTDLYLYHNYISNIQPCTFHNLKKLKVLLLGTNKLLNLNNIFNVDLAHLEELDLHSNKISIIKKDTFKGLHSLKILNLCDNQIKVIEKNAFMGLQSLKKLALTSNHISTIAGLFLGMPKLEYLTLAANYISFHTMELKNPPFENLKSLKQLSINSQRHSIENLPSNLLKGLKSLFRFDGGHLNIDYVHPDIFKHTPKLNFLDLNKNVFTNENSLSASVFHSIPRLSELHLSQCKLTSLNFLFGANLSHLSILTATDNQIQVINQTLVQSLPRLSYLEIQNNTFICDCSNAWFLNWSKNDNYTQVVNLNNFACSYPPTMKGQLLENFNTDSCIVHYEFIYFLCSSSLVIATLFLSFVYNFLRWQLVYAYYLFLALLYNSKQRQRQHQQGFQYDAFISYNSQDELWVLRELLPNLEAKQGWRLCLHHRDFEPGKSIIDNIVDSIYSSRKTICLITHNYLRSEWCSREIQVASFRLFDEKNDVLILVFLEDIPTHQLSPYYRMRKLVKKHTYLTWPKPGEDTNVFWQKLQIAMKTKKDENPILLGLDN